MGQSGLGDWEGPVTIASVTVAMSTLLGAVLYQHEIATIALRLYHRVFPVPDPPDGPPIERLASDVRRLRSELRTPAPGLPMARRIGISRAYDDVLVGACHALDVPDTLSGLPPGTERDAERLRVEWELEEAGLRLSP